MIFQPTGAGFPSRAAGSRWVLGFYEILIPPQDSKGWDSPGERQEGNTECPPHWEISERTSPNEERNSTASLLDLVRMSTSSGFDRPSPELSHRSKKIISLFVCLFVCLFVSGEISLFTKPSWTAQETPPSGVINKGHCTNGFILARKIKKEKIEIKRAKPKPVAFRIAKYYQ